MKKTAAELQAELAEIKDAIWQIAITARETTAKSPSADVEPLIEEITARIATAMGIKAT